MSEVADYFRSLQAAYCQRFAAQEGEAVFMEDAWERPDGSGGGLTCILEGGRVFERVAVNFSAIRGQRMPASASQARPELAEAPFFATGLSIIAHPVNPYAPTSHANVRFFEAYPRTGAPVFWFGGGYDLTPYYGFDADCIHWHQTAKAACDPFGLEIYPALKTACDDYFYLPHRQEARGIGGLFFDDWHRKSFADSLAFTQAIGESYGAAYFPILARRSSTPFGEEEVLFQRYRRGRYVEFNLLYDRGTLFGLQSGGRTASILASLPKQACWGYDDGPIKDSPSARALAPYLKPTDWLLL